MASVEVDVQELSELLFGAKERYRSAQATITHTVDAPLAEEANRRFVDWHFAQDNPGMGIIRKPGPPAREDFYEDYEDTKEVINLWHERPDLWREERWSAGGELLRCVVFGSARGPRWVYEPPRDGLLHSRQHGRVVQRRSFTDRSFLLNPSEELFYYSLLDDATVHKTGRRATVADREAVEVVVGTISWGYPPTIFHGFFAQPGAES
jgi:hypothetical protein